MLRHGLHRIGELTGQQVHNLLKVEVPLLELFVCLVPLMHPRNVIVRLRAPSIVEYGDELGFRYIDIGLDHWRPARRAPTFGSKIFYV